MGDLLLHPYTHTHKDLTMSAWILFLILPALINSAPETFPSSRVAPKLDNPLNQALQEVATNMARCAATCALDPNGMCTGGVIPIPKPCVVMKPLFEMMMG